MSDSQAAIVTRDEAMEIADFHRRELAKRPNDKAVRRHRDRIQYWFQFVLSFDQDEGGADGEDIPNNFHAYRPEADGTLTRLDAAIEEEVTA